MRARASHSPCELREEAVILEEHGGLFETRDSFFTGFLSRLLFRPPTLYNRATKRRSVVRLVVYERVQ